MAEFRLTARPALGGYDRTIGTLGLRELTGLGIVSLAVPQGGEEKCADALRDAWGVECPVAGRYSRDDKGRVLVLRMQPDQFFVLIDNETAHARQEVHEATKGFFWSTDQSDVWCALEISGPGVREAMARICMLDLHPERFGPDAVARTVMEHMGAIILRNGADSFRLLVARSSAGSFLHAVEVSAQNIAKD